MKPEMKMEDGVLKVFAVAGVDTDKDGQQAIGLKVELFLDAKEVVAEIVKQETPQWLRDIVLPNGSGIVQ